MFSLAEYRRRRLRKRPFPQEWEELLVWNIPRYKHLSASDREELNGYIQVFLAEEHFEGAAGLVITDEIRVTIAAQG